MARPDRDRGYRPQMNIAAPLAAPVEPVSASAAAEPAADPPEPDKATAAPVPAPVAAQPEPAPPESPAPAPAAPVGPKGHVLARWCELGTYGGPFFTFPACERKAGAKGPTVGWFPEASVDKFVKSFERL